MVNDGLNVVSLGDQAALAYLPGEEDAIHFASVIRAGAPVWLVDVVQAYTSVAVFFDLEQIGFAAVVSQLKEWKHWEPLRPATQTTRTHTVPCCYEFQLDLQRIAQHTGLDQDEVIRLHAATEYTVYAIGFCPGFPFLGYLPPPLCGVPRLQSPRVRVEGGSVGLTGRQTGIYTEVRPGGWNLLGKTPLQLVDVADEYFPLRTGDKLRFQRIDETEFRRLTGERL
jgi:inhibitor of KinA